MVCAKVTLPLRGGLACPGLFPPRFWSIRGERVIRSLSVITPAVGNHPARGG